MQCFGISFQDTFLIAKDSFDINSSLLRLEDYYFLNVTTNVQMLVDLCSRKYSIRFNVEIELETM